MSCPHAFGIQLGSTRGDRFNSYHDNSLVKKVNGYTICAKSLQPAAD